MGCFDRGWAGEQNTKFVADNFEKQACV